MLLAASDLVTKIDAWTSAFGAAVWSTPTALLLTGAGLLFTILTLGVQWRIFSHGFSVIRGKYDNPDDQGNISHFQALCAALSATIGLGNISGVAVAVGLGGPGAVFWMWVVGLLGMATKFTTCSLGTMFRRKDRYGEYRGGPMYYMEIGLGKSPRPFIRVLGKVLAITFAIMGMCACFGIGNMYQSREVAGIYVNLAKHVSTTGLSTDAQFAVRLVVGAVMAAFAGLVMLGGIKRIGSVASRLVPSMCIIYVAGALYIILSNVTLIPGVFESIFKSAFTSVAGQGAFLGVAVRTAISHGIRRACFSNEAGLGSAPMAHATARTDEPIREGVVAGLGPFIDTIVICTMTALVILITSAHSREAVGKIASATADWGAPQEQAVTVEVTIDVADESVAEIGEKFFIRVPAEPGVDDALQLVIDSVDAGQGNLAAATLVYPAGEGGHKQLETHRPLLQGHSEVYLHREGIQLTALAFDRGLTGFGTYFIPIAALLFAFSTMISWGFYGETCATYLFGDRVVFPFKCFYVLVIIVGVLFSNIGAVINLADGMNGLMLVPNLIGTILLLPIVLRASRDYFRRLSNGAFDQDLREAAAARARVEHSPRDKTDA
ncbi:MAG: alanine:cation symporter family protein [Phycisphaerae bacterium]|nr:alanine:cation symporter family protein [Phycisphaerae bacterium]